MGKVTVNGTTVEAKSMDGEMIDEDTDVEVIKIDWANIIVAKIKEPHSSLI